MKTALVTGSSRGIGKAIAIQLAKSGYRVVINGRNTSDVNEVVKNIESLGGQAVPMVCDFSEEKNVNEAVKFISAEFDRLDLLVTNIGSGTSTAGVQIELSEWKNVFDINFFSTVLAVQSFLPLLKNSAGQVICISSIAGIEALGAPIAYSCAKATLISYVKNLARPLAESNIRINSISPGNVYFEGGTWDKKLKKNEAEIKKYIETNVALKKFITPEEIAEAVSFLAASSNITGHNLVVDGGQNRQC